MKTREQLESEIKSLQHQIAMLPPYSCVQNKITYSICNYAGKKKEQKPKKKYGISPTNTVCSHLRK